MKKTLIISSVFLALLMASCGGKNAGAKNVADKFVKTFFQDVDFEGARQYVSAELQDEFPEESQMADLEKHFVNILREHSSKHGYEAKYDASRSKVEENTAELYYTLTAKGNPEWSSEGEVELEKNADGKWIVTDYEFDRDESALDFGF